LEFAALGSVLLNIEWACEESSNLSEHSIVRRLQTKDPAYDALPALNLRPDVSDGGRLIQPFRKGGLA